MIRVTPRCTLFPYTTLLKIHQNYKHKYFVRKVRAIIVTRNFTIVKWSLWQITFYRNVIEGCGLSHSIKPQELNPNYKHKYFVRYVIVLVVFLEIVQLKNGVYGFFF